jgi:hypothetical protein
MALLFSRRFKKDLAEPGGKSGKRYRIYSLVREPGKYDSNGNPNIC